MRRVAFRAVGVALTALMLTGCALWDWIDAHDPSSEPPCDENNPYRCGDGTCCYTGESVCWGPDNTGQYYCESEWYNPDDPTHMYSAKPRHYARKPDKR